jgi:hypothetical protein
LFHCLNLSKITAIVAAAVRQEPLLPNPYVIAWAFEDPLAAAMTKSASDRLFLLSVFGLPDLAGTEVFSSWP